MKYDKDFVTLMQQAHAERQQFIGGLLRSAWNGAFDFIRRRFNQSQSPSSSGRRGFAKASIAVMVGALGLGWSRRRKS